MIKLLFFILILLVFNFVASAAIQTDTHFYFLSPHSQSVTAVNRQTGEEKPIKFDSNVNALSIYDNFGYFIHTDAREISVLDLNTNKIIKTIEFGTSPISLTFHNGLGYLTVLNSRYIFILDPKTNEDINSIDLGELYGDMFIKEDVGYVIMDRIGNIAVIDLKSNKVVKKIQAGKDPVSMVFNEGFGYVVNRDSQNVSVFDLKTNALHQTIPVGDNPKSITFHKSNGYVMNKGSQLISVIDLKSHTVNNSISVNRGPTFMTVGGDYGFVVSDDSDFVSVIDLKTNIKIKEFQPGYKPQPMVVHNGFGYILHLPSSTIVDYGWGGKRKIAGSKHKEVFVIDLNTLVGKNRFETPIIQDPYNEYRIDFSDTNIYWGDYKLAPIYPTFDSIKKMRIHKQLIDFKRMNPKAFEVGEVKPRDYPVEENGFDQMPPYALAQEIFWDLKSDKPRMDPKDILSTLTIMKYPQRFLQTEAGQWLRDKLYTLIFQAVWLEQNEKVQEMLRYLIQLDDPVMTKLTHSILTNVPGYKDAIEDQKRSKNSGSK